MTQEPNIGVFDSGAGGISVLAQAVKLLPHESFVYFGDSAFTPYGEKDPDWIIDRSRYIVQRFIEDGAKAVVIACNTATSVAAASLREEYSSIPIIGVEPALKPAALSPEAHRILVMATPITLRLDKYHSLASQWGEGLEVKAVECPGLADCIEQGHLNDDVIFSLVENLVGAYKGWPDSVVLGCTHYGFVAPIIAQVLGDVPLWDGAQGTARHLRRRLQDAGMEAPAGSEASVEFFTSAEPKEEVLRRYRDLFVMACNAAPLGVQD